MKRILALILVVFAASASMPTARASLDDIRCDFDADGFADLAVGVPGESIGSSSNAGAVNVLYGTTGGLSADRNQLWHQGSPDVPGVAGETENNQFFGWDLACGDFDGNGSSDLAIGVPEENVDIDGESVVDAGAVNVIYGSSTGLTGVGSQLWHQGSPGVPGSPEKSDRFGRAVAAGDFNNDGFDDLAVAATHENLTGIKDHGMIHILFGSPAGLTTTDTQLLGEGGTLGWAGDTSYLGSTLVVGDFDGDDYDDLVLGTINDWQGHYLRVVRGSASGLDPATSMLLPEPDGLIGQISVAGASGDVNGDGFDDYVAGAFHYVHVWPGSQDGLVIGEGTSFDHTSPGIPVELDEESHFGSAVGVGDIDNDGYGDVLIGANGHWVDGTESAGAAVVLFGTAGGLTTGGSQLWHQDSPGIDGSAERHDQMGGAVHLDDFNGDGYTDGVISVADENITTFGTSKPDAGLVHVLAGTADGLTDDGSEIWHQARTGIAGAVETGDRFGQRDN